MGLIPIKPPLPPPETVRRMVRQQTPLTGSLSVGAIDAFIHFMETTDPLLRDAILTVLVTFPLWLTIGVLAWETLPDALRGPLTASSPQDDPNPVPAS